MSGLKFPRKKYLSLSVVIVTHNRRDRLQRCIETILLNSSKPDEIIIVDDSDLNKDSEKLVRTFQEVNPHVKFAFKRVYPKRGVSFSRNCGIKASSGNIISFVDDDCDVHKDWVKNTIKSHNNHSQVGAITGYVLPKYPTNYWNMVLFKFHDEKVLCVKETDFLFGANYSFKREVFSKYRLFFNEKMSYFSEDHYITSLLLRKNFRLIFNPKIIVYHDFRTTIKGISVRWFEYGLSDYFFWKLTPSYSNSDSEYFKKGNPYKKLIKSLYRIPKRISEVIRSLKVKENEKHLLPGLILIYFFYYVGVYYGLIRDGLVVIQKEAHGS